MTESDKRAWEALREAAPTEPFYQLSLEDGRAWYDAAQRILRHVMAPPALIEWLARDLWHRVTAWQLPVQAHPSDRERALAVAVRTDWKRIDLHNSLAKVELRGVAAYVGLPHRTIAFYWLHWGHRETQPEGTMQWTGSLTLGDLEADAQHFPS